MPKQKLICVKELTYMTRHLTPGMSFEAKPRDARVLKAIGKARDDYDAPVNEALAQPAAPVAPAPAAPAPAPVVSTHEEHTHDPLDALRDEAAALGLHVDRRWGETRLMTEIDDAREKAAKDHAPTPESSETETSATEAQPPVAMTTDSAADLMPNPYRHDPE